MQNPPPTDPNYQPGYRPNAPYGSPSGSPGGANEKSALGLEGNVTAAIGYIIGILALILIFIEKDNRFVRFHAMQSVLFAVAVSVLLIAVSILSTIVMVAIAAVSSSLATIVGLLVSLLFFGLLLVMAGGLLFAAYKAYQGQMFKLPFVGDMAANMTNK